VRGTRGLSLAGIAAAVSLLVAPAANGPDLATVFDDYVTQAVEDWEAVGLAVAVVKDGELVFAKGYGIRDIEAAGAVDAHTLFAIGSTTKAITAAAIGILRDEGKLDWDDKVTTHLPDFELFDPYVTRELTIRDLLTHRAGLGNADSLWYRTDISAADVVARARFIEPAYSFRAGYTYQNIMYATAGAVVEAVSGQSWATFVQERILTPMGMTGTVPLFTDTDGRDNVAAPHYRIDGELIRADNASVDNVAAAGSIWSSVTDMSRWMRLMLGGGELDGIRLLEPATHAELLRPQIVIPPGAFYPTTQLTQPHWTTYALGWFQHDYDGRFVSFHTGSIDGMVAINGLIPDEDLGVYVLGNLDHVEIRHALMYKAFDLWGGEPDGRDWSTDLREMYAEATEQQRAAFAAFRASRIEDTAPSRQLIDFAGVYSDPLFGQIEIGVDGDSLVFEAAGRSAAMEHWHYDAFVVAWERPWLAPTAVAFAFDLGGTPTIRAFGRTFQRVRDQ
jgi:CubicO group peptidase (beta-lactamase class C family)